MNCLERDASLPPHQGSLPAPLVRDVSHESLLLFLEDLGHAVGVDPEAVTAVVDVLDRFCSPFEPVGEGGNAGCHGRGGGSARKSRGGTRKFARFLTSMNPRMPWFSVGIEGVSPSASNPS